MSADVDALLQAMKADDEAHAAAEAQRRAVESAQMAAAEAEFKVVNAEKRRQKGLVQRQRAKEQALAKQKVQEDTAKKAALKALKNEESTASARLRRREAQESKLRKQAEWSSKPPTKEENPQPAAVQLWQRRARQARRFYKQHHRTLFAGGVVLLLVVMTVVAVVQDRQDAASESADGHIEMIFAAAGAEYTPAISTALVKQQRQWDRAHLQGPTLNVRISAQIVPLSIQWSLEQLDRPELVTLLGTHGHDIVEEEETCVESGNSEEECNAAAYSKEHLLDLATMAELKLFAQMDPAQAAKLVYLTRILDEYGEDDHEAPIARAVEPRRFRPQEIRQELGIPLLDDGGAGLIEAFGWSQPAPGELPLITEEQIDAADEEQQAEATARQAMGVQQFDYYDLSTLGEGAKSDSADTAWIEDNARLRQLYEGDFVRTGAVRWAPCGERAGVLPLPRHHPNYHWASDWSLAVEGAQAAQRRALQLRRGNQRGFSLGDGFRPAPDQ